MHTVYFLQFLLAILAGRILYVLSQILTSPLRSIPGPFWTGFTKLWYFNRVRLGRFEQDNIALHRKYGSIVRIAPNWYSIDDPSAIKTVYGVGTKFLKSDWYEGWKHPSPDRWTLFPDRDAKRHAETRKRFQAMYSLSSLVTYEPYVDECARIFERRLSEFAEKGVVLNMGHWLQCYAFDVIGDITYGQRFGFLDRGEDVEGTMRALQSSMIYSTLIGIYAKWHPFLFGILSRFDWTGAGGRTYIMKFVGARISQRKEEEALPNTANEDAVTDNQKAGGVPQDFLGKMLQANKEDPQKVTDYHVFMMGLSNIIAGSDTTAVSLSSILYYLLRYPVTMRKLQEEIKDCEARGRCDNPVTFKQSQEMPYLQAVMKEALRMHAATGLPLWRVVPDGGAHIAGHFFPAGTVVGINTWTAHYSKVVFGKDANEFRPERWTEAAKDDGQKLKEVESYYMPFGLGSRTCLGKHISILEMSKLVPQLIRKFEFELVQPENSWITENYWFVKPIDFEVRVKLRDTEQGNHNSTSI